MMAYNSSWNMLHIIQPTSTDSPFHLSILCLNQRFLWDITLLLGEGFLTFHRQLIFEVLGTTCPLSQCHMSKALIFQPHVVITSNHAGYK
jgi:hypothetical protein